MKALLKASCFLAGRMKGAVSSNSFHNLFEWLHKNDFFLHFFLPWFLHKWLWDTQTSTKLPDFSRYYIISALFAARKPLRESGIEHIQPRHLVPCISWMTCFPMYTLHGITWPSALTNKLVWQGHGPLYMWYILSYAEIIQNDCLINTSRDQPRIFVPLSLYKKACETCSSGMLSITDKCALLSASTHTHTCCDG